MLSAKLLFLPTLNFHVEISNSLNENFTDFNIKNFKIPQKVIFWTERIILYAEKLIL